MGNYPEKWKGYYLTAYGIAVKHGFQGSEEDWLRHLKAGEMELRYEDGLLQWKTSKEAGWHTLEEFSLLQEQLEESAQKASTAAQAAVLAGQGAEAAGQQAQAAASAATEAAGQALEAKAAAEQAAEAAENTAEAAAQEALNAANTAAQNAVNTASAAAQSAENIANSAAQTALTQGNYAKEQGDRAAQLVNEIEETDVGGMAADILELQTDLDGHAGNQNNPHGVTAAQVGVTAKRTCRFVVGTSTNGWTQDDCDYLCDGVDDQVEIQAAIDALPNSGGYILILGGTYNISAPMSISTIKNNVTISGEKSGTGPFSYSNHLVILKDSIPSQTSVSTFIDFKKLYYLRLSDLKIHFYSHASSSGTILTVSSANISNVSIDGSSKTHFGILGGMLLENLCIRGCSYGIVDTDGASISNSHFEYNEIAIRGGSINSQNPGKITIIQGNRFENCESAINVGSNCNYLVCDNVIDSSTGTAIHIDNKSDSYGDGFALAANNLILQSGSGITLWSNNGIVDGNNIINRDEYGEYGYPIDISGNGNLISNNIIWGKNYRSEGTGNTFVNNKYN